MSATLILSGLAFALYLVYGALNYGHRRKDMPTGPKTLPFIGNLYQIPRSYAYLKFARQFGGIFTLKMGSATMAVISDRRLVRALIDKKSNIYSDRPPSHVTHDLITKGHHLLHLPIVNAEAVQLIHDLKLYPKDYLLYPKRFSNSIINSIPVPEKLWDNYKTRSLTVGDMMETLYEEILTDVEKRRGTRNLGSFIDIVLNQQDKLQLSRDKLKFLGGGIIEGGSGTSATLILIIIQALTLNLEVQEKAHREIAVVVGEDRSPQWSDMKNLPYINMIVKEGHRWRPILPLDDWVDGKFLPKDTIIMLNIWGMHMDPQTWEEPEKFNPDRHRDHPKLAHEYAASTISKLIWAFKFKHETGPDGRQIPIDSDPVTGYRTGTLYVPNKYSFKPVLRSEVIRDTVMREFGQAERDVFSRFDVSWSG
ncbi:uncharacterized protein K452DRAFT_330207 [Aplosporella prunicola CBS 121167]|uniref:Cytochrome P450 n=1 Tax=Aplosporella prunicola CBS 121167 TaxID=1176127 RepID=A0A6A6AW69_9PEZI|nr:uncharacterized protein K452DRAFT_330207 [Aplosporella prunicola CBS 121167]KAF2135433.1 hypothetical protein K452DRAFT_330207 [Aplosporella prunicola CBS 121167]